MSSLKRLVIVGISGRMGSELEALAGACGFKLVAGISRSTPGALASIRDVKAVDCDVVIDFSTPALTDEVAAWCVANNKPLVSGVTGLSEAQLSTLRTAGAKLPVFWAPNMSPGVAVVKRMLAHLSTLSDFDFQVEEFHHTRKRDKPSGTAIALQNALTAAIQKPLPEPVAIRGGGIFGLHRVFAMGEEEVITIEHNALSRAVFARGALRAAQWVLAALAGFLRHGQPALVGWRPRDLRQV